MRKRRRDWSTLFLMILLAALAVALLVGKQRCDKRGGTYVRGLFWMTCIQADTLNTNDGGRDG